MGFGIKKRIPSDPLRRLSHKSDDPLPVYVKNLEVEFKKKNGEMIAVLLTAYEGLNIDISDQKRMERELKEGNEFLLLQRL